MGEAEDWERLRTAANRYRNWGRWGPDDELGTVNFVTDEMRANAAKLVKRGHVFSLAFNYDMSGPWYYRPNSKRFNTMHLMMRDGLDAANSPNGMNSADDATMMITHGATHWDALAHIFYEGKMWNGYDAKLVTSNGAEKNAITKLVSDSYFKLLSTSNPLAKTSSGAA